MISGNLTIDISDHLPSFLIISRKGGNILPKHNTYTRNTKQFDRENFILDYLSKDWTKIMEVEKKDPNLSLSNMLSEVDELIDIHMPLRKMTNKEYKRKFEPWISKDLLIKI